VGPRRRRVAWTNEAKRDLDETAGFIAQDSPQAAARIVEHLLASAGSLDELGERGRIVLELGDAHLREVFVLSFRVIYRVSEVQVMVLGVLHQRCHFDDWRRSDLADGSDSPHTNQRVLQRAQEAGASRARREVGMMRHAAGLLKQLRYGV